MRFRRLGETTVVVLAAIALACLFTYPYIFSFGTGGRLDTNDGKWSIWVVAWVAHALTTDPLNVYQANIFHPHANTLTYSEANLVEGAIAAPVWLATRSPYAAHNFVVLFSFVLSALGGYYLVRHLTGSRHAAAVSAVLFAFCPFVFARTAHIQLLLVGFLPFCMLAFHRLLDRPTMARALALGVVLWLTGLACAYYGIFGGGMVALGSLYFSVTRGRWREWRYWLALGVAATICIGLTVPFFLPYLELQRETGFGRQLADVLQYSANTGAWLASSAWAHRWWISAIKGFSEVLFPGFLAIGLGLTGAWLGLRHAPTSAGASGMRRDTVVFYVLTAVLTVWFTFGPNAGLYTVLHNNLPVFSFLRAPSRAGIVVTLCLAVLAGVALTRLLEGRRRATLITVGVFVLACADLFQAPLRMREALPVSPAYRELARMPRGPVAVFRFWGRPSSFHGHSEYMLESTFHWQPLINGYSDHIPQDFRDAARLLGGFPDEASFGELERRGARYVVLHLDLYAGSSRDEVTGKLEAYSQYLRPLSQQDDNTWLFEIVGWPR